MASNTSGTRPFRKGVREQSRREERLNSLSHAAGLAAALAVTPFLIAAAGGYGDGTTQAGALVFGLSIALVYASSAIYHALPAGWPQGKRTFNVIDHVAVYFLIAGTYTPFALGVLRGPLGWTLLAVVWTLAISGTLLKCRGLLWNRRLSLAFYLLMGWLVLLVIVPLAKRLDAGSLACLLAGGLLYTAGTAFYMAHHKRYAHFVWHLFVLGGTGLHVAAVFGMYRG